MYVRHQMFPKSSSFSTEEYLAEFGPAVYHEQRRHNDHYSACNSLEQEYRHNYPPKARLPRKEDVAKGGEDQVNRMRCSLHRTGRKLHIV